MLRPKDDFCLSSDTYLNATRKTIYKNGAPNIITLDARNVHIELCKIGERFDAVGEEEAINLVGQAMVLVRLLYGLLDEQQAQDYVEHNLLGWVENQKGSIGNEIMTDNEYLEFCCCKMLPPPWKLRRAGYAVLGDLIWCNTANEWRPVRQKDLGTLATHRFIAQIDLEEIPR